VTRALSFGLAGVLLAYPAFAQAPADSMIFHNMENAAGAAACGLVSAHDAQVAIANDGMDLIRIGQTADYVKMETGLANLAGGNDATLDGYCAEPGLAAAVRMQMQFP
jgi:hypothetical protein